MYLRVLFALSLLAFAPSCFGGPCTGWFESCFGESATEGSGSSSTTTTTTSTTVSPEMCEGGMPDGVCDNAGAGETPQTCPQDCFGCGDGYVDSATMESCDDGPDNVAWAMGQGACNLQCNGGAAYCGDGFVNGPETCDPKALAVPCSNDCQVAVPFCGDGTCNGGEDASSCARDCEAVCGDGVLQPGELCDAAMNPQNCNPDCTAPVICGDGVVHAASGEQCDDGNNSNTDTCVACQHATCGDGFVRAGLEECDDGNAVDDDGCSNTCKLPRRMFVTADPWAGGQVGSVAAASGKCATAATGKVNLQPGHVWRVWLSDSNANSAPAKTVGKENLVFDGYYLRPDEVALAKSWAGLSGRLLASPSVTENGTPQNDGLPVWTNTDGMGTQTSLQSCSNWTTTMGTGAVGLYEATDMTWTEFINYACNTVAHLYCFEMSQHADGVQQADEACDDGNVDDTDDCLTSGQLAACGDGFVHSGVEACDDGNASDIDGCTTTCQLATCGDGFLHDGVEACDDGNVDDTDFCRNDCTKATCGDGVVWPLREDCDDGNTSNEDDCTANCRKAACGDGYVNMGEEACDDGNKLDGDGCSASCTAE